MFQQFHQWLLYVLSRWLLPQFCSTHKQFRTAVTRSFGFSSNADSYRCCCMLSVFGKARVSHSKTSFSCADTRFTCLACCPPFMSEEFQETPFLVQRHHPSPCCARPGSDASGPKASGRLPSMPSAAGLPRLLAKELVSWRWAWYVQCKHASGQHMLCLTFSC